jgi:ATP-dependent DNA ligase
MGEGRGFAGRQRDCSVPGRLSSGSLLVDAPLPMLAQLATRLPTSAGWRYEPKLDGFRALLAHQPGGYVRLTSRNQKDLAPWFPEVLGAGRCLPSGTIVDGELVVADEQSCADFGALQARLTVPIRQTLAAAATQPAVLVVFDVLECNGKDVSGERLDARRRLLEGLVPGRHPCLQLMMQTSDALLARDWLAHVAAVEGVVAKRADGRYRPGRREWVKGKRQRTADCVVVGLAGDVEAPALVLGLHHQDRELHHLGRLGGVICHLQANQRGWPKVRQHSGGRRGAPLATARTPPTSGRSRMRSTSDNSRGVRGSMRAGANNAIRELGGLFGVGVLALEEFQNAWHELFVVLEDAAVSGVLVKPASTAGRR